MCDDTRSGGGLKVFRPPLRVLCRVGESAPLKGGLMMQSGIYSGITGDVRGHEGVDEGGLTRVQLGEASEERPNVGRRSGR